MNSTYSKPHKVQHRVEAKLVCRFLGVLKADKHIHNFPPFFAGVFELNQFLDSAYTIMPWTSFYWPQNWYHMHGKLSPLCPGWSKLDRCSHQMQRSDPKKWSNETDFKKWFRLQICCSGITWEIVRITNSRAPPLTCWLRIFGVGVSTSLHFHSFFRWPDAYSGLRSTDPG